MRLHCYLNLFKYNKFFLNNNIMICTKISDKCNSKQALTMFANKEQYNVLSSLKVNTKITKQV